MVHLGKMFLLGSDWYGTWDSKNETEASRFADNYYQLRDQAVDFLSDQYKEVVKDVKEGKRPRSAAPAEDRPVTPRSTISTTGARPGSMAERCINYWNRTPGTNIRMVESRVNRIMRLPDDEVNDFIANAPLSAEAKRKLRTLLRERTANGR
jgi:hypothetical protein